MRRFAPLVFALAFACAGPARAQPSDLDLPLPDPPDYWRVMDQTYTATTSKCLGNPITPLCAVEHIIACEVRRDDELCMIAMGRGRGPSSPTPKDFDFRTEYERYRVASAKLLRAGVEDLPLPAFENPRDIPNDVRPGDAMLELRQSECRRKENFCFGDSGSSRYYFLRKSGERWVVLKWVTPSDRGPRPEPDLPPPDPPDFWRIMDQDSAASTSKCLFVPTMPLCAVEQIIACFVRKSDEFCRLGLGLERAPGYVHPKHANDEYERYRVAGAKLLRLGVEDLPKSAFKFRRGVPRTIRYGDLMLEVRQVECRRTPRHSCQPDVGSSFYYFLRRSGDRKSGERWVVVDWWKP